MSVLGKITDFLSGGLGSSIVDSVKEYFPPSMSEQEKAELSLRISNAADQKEIKLMQLANESEKEFNDRISELEGTAQDLKSIWLLGPLVIFIRGCQRPVWGFSTLYMDYKVFSGSWGTLSEYQEQSLWIINLLVLGFLFGERAIKNLLPLIERIIKVKLGIK